MRHEDALYVLGRLVCQGCGPCTQTDEWLKIFLEFFPENAKAVEEVSKDLSERKTNADAGKS